MADPRVLMKYFPGATRVGFDFARPSLGYQQGKDGIWTQVPVDQLCDGHYMIDPTTGKLVRTLLLEPEGGTNMVLNPDFEDSVPGYAPHWDEAPSRNLLGPDAGVEIVAEGAERYLYVGTTKRMGDNPTAVHAEPLAHYGLQGGDTITIGHDARVEGGATGSRLRTVFYDSTGAPASGAVDTSPTVSSETWTAAGRASIQVPESAVSWVMYTRFDDAPGGSTRHFRSVMVNRGGPLPYEAPSHVAYDPEGAYSGNRYAVLTATGPTRYMPHLDGTGQVRRWPVRAGDVVSFGAWIYRESADGTGYGRLHCMPYDDQGALQSTVGSPTVLNDEWTLSEGTYIVPEGIAWVGLRCLCNVGDGTTATARFDKVFLRILRAGVTTRAADSLTWDPIP